MMRDGRQPERTWREFGDEMLPEDRRGGTSRCGRAFLRGRHAPSADRGDGLYLAAQRFPGAVSADGGSFVRKTILNSPPAPIAEVQRTGHP